MIIARRIAQSDIEVIQIFQRAGDGLAGGQPDRDLRTDRLSIARTRPRIQEARLQRNRIVFFPNARYVAGGRVASLAAAGAMEIFATFVAIACNDVLDAISVAIDSGLLARAQERSDVLDLIGGQMKR